MAKATLSLEIDLRAFSEGLKTALRIGQEFGKQIDGALRGVVRLDTAAFDEELRRYEASLAGLADSRVDIDASGAVSGLSEVTQGVVKAEVQTKTSVGRIRDQLAVWGFAIRGVSNLLTMAGKGVEFMIGASREVERLQLRLHGLYQDAGLAAEAYKKFEDVAKRTPATLQQVTEAGATLKAFGLDAVATLESVVDLASYMGMDLVEAASAVGRSFAGGVGASEIFRERGVLALIKSFSGLEDLTTLTLPEFRKVMLETLSDPSAGIAGSAERISKSFAGAASNIQDAMFRLRTLIGNGLLPTLTRLLNTGIDIIDWFAGLHGWLKAALVILPLATSAWYKLAAAKVTVAIASGALTAAITASIVAIKTFWVTIGPVGWALMAITAAMGIFAVASDKAKRSTTEAEKAHASIKKAMQDAAESAGAEAEEMDILGKKLLDLKAKSALTTAEKGLMADTIKQLNAKYGDYLGNINLETAGYNELKTALAGANKELVNKMTLQAYQDVLFGQVQAVAKAKVALANELNKSLNVRVPSTQDNFMSVAHEQLRMLENRFNDWKTNPTYMAIRRLYDRVKTETDTLKDATNEYNNAVSQLNRKGEQGAGDDSGTDKRLSLLDAFYQEMKWKAAGYYEYQVGVYARDRDEFVKVVGDKDKALVQYDERVRLLGEERAKWEAELARMSPDELAALKEKEGLINAYYATLGFAAEDYFARQMGNIESERLRYIELTGEKGQADAQYEAKKKALELERDKWEAEQMNGRIMAARAENNEKLKQLDSQIEKLEKWKSLGLGVEEELKAAWVSYHETLKAQSEASKKAWEDAESGKVQASEAELAILKALYEADYEAYLVALDKRKQAELLLSEALRKKWEDDNKFKVGMIDGLADSMRSVWMTVLDTSMTGSERIKVLWRSMASSWVSLIGNMSADWLKNELKRIAMKAATDKAETAIVAQGEATRLGIIQGSALGQIAIKVATAVKTVAVYLYETAAAITAWYAKILGPLAPIATLGTMAAVVGMINTFRKGFAGGGYTGDGSRSAEAGVVHRGEYVFEQPITRGNLRGLAWLREKLQQGIRIEEIIPAVNMRYAPVPMVASGGYAGGGYVGGQRGDNDLLSEIRALRKLWEGGVKATMNLGRREMSLEMERGQSERKRLG